MIVVSTAEEMNPLRRCTMEDVHIVMELKNQMYFLAIYDGHGGRDTVDFLQQALHKNVEYELMQSEEQLEEEEEVDNDENKNNTMKPRVSIETKLERALLITDIQSRKYGITSSGATVAVCLIDPHASIESNNNNNNSRKNECKDNDDDCTMVYTANAGDARIVAALHHTRTALRISQDHRANDIPEMQRIEQQGGFCFKGRVMGVLAVSRSLGDHGLKQYVTAHPSTFTTSSTNSSLNSASTTTTTSACQSQPKKQRKQQKQQKLDFIILGCDGLWDVLSDQQAIDLVYQHKGDKSTVASKLTRVAMEQGSTDNITVIVCWL